MDDIQTRIYSRLLIVLTTASYLYPIRHQFGLDYFGVKNAELKSLHVAYLIIK